MPKTRTHIIHDAMILEPGDKVLLFMDVTDGEAVDIRTELARHFPGVDFAVISGAEGYVMKRRGPTVEQV